MVYAKQYFMLNLQTIKQFISLYVFYEFEEKTSRKHLHITMLAFYELRIIENRDGLSLQILLIYEI